MTERGTRAAVLDVGSRAGGERHEWVCRTCGYGAVLGHEPPECPMCHGSEWDPRSPRPFLTSMSDLDPRAG